MCIRDRDVDMLIFNQEGCHKISEEELDKIKSRITPITRKLSRRFEKIIKDIVENRKIIRDLSKKLFGFELFYQNEEALWRVMTPCKTEEDFTSNICALCLLIDEMNCTQMEKFLKGDRKIQGSINLLEQFLKDEFSLSDEEIRKITVNLRDIRILRSKRAPIHRTQPELIDTILKLGYHYPPNWGSLWIDILGKYNESLNEIKRIFKKRVEKS